MEETGRGAGSSVDRLRVALGEKEFWTALWAQAPFPMWDEAGLDLARFGPITAACLAEERGELGLNFILGSSEAGAVEHGHLADAASWLETRPVPAWGTMAEEFGVDFRVPVVPGLPDAAAAERWLRERGAVPEAGLGRLVRDTSPPRFDPPAGIDVLDWEECDEGFPEPLIESLELPSGAFCLFLGLPVADDEAWRCFGALDGEDPVAYAAMRLDAGVATLVFASRPSELRDGAGQTALLHRCIREAAAAGCGLIAVTDAGQALPVIDRECLLRAGFEVAFETTIWHSRVTADV